MYYRKNRLTKTQIRKAIAKQKRSLESQTTGSQRNNPQVVEMANITRGKITALEAVLDAMNGGLCLLNMLSEDY